jgi:hypothetical protein
MSLTTPAVPTQALIDKLRAVPTSPIRDVLELCRLAADELTRLDDIRRLYAQQIHYWMHQAGWEADK